MLWSIETDDFFGKCGEKYPLLKTLNAELRGGIPPKVDPPEESKPDEKTDKIPTQKPDEKPQPPSTGICKKEGYVRDEHDCSIFYQCLNINGVYQAQKFNCPSELAFDPQINNCNYKNLVDGCN